MKDKVVRLVHGNLYGPATALKSKVLKWGNRKKLKIQIFENRATRVNLRTLPVQKKLVRTAKRLQGQSFKIWSTRTINTLRKSSIFSQKMMGITAGYSTGSMETLRKNVLICGMFMFSSLQAAIHLARTRTSRKFRTCSISQSNWHWSILKRFWMWRWFTAPLHPGRDQYCLMIQWPSGQRQKYLCTPIPFYDWGKWVIAKVQVKGGKVKWKKSKCPFLTKSWQESMEKQSDSNGIFSKDLHHCSFFRKFRMICEKDLQTRSLSCQCSTILARTLDVLRSWRWKEVVWNSSFCTCRKWDSTATQLVERFKDTGYPGVVEFLKKTMSETPYTSMRMLQAQLLFRIIHSVNQLSIHGAVANWYEQFGLTEEEKEQEWLLGRKEPVTKGVFPSVNSQEVKLLVPSPRLAPGNRLRRNIQGFKSLSETIRFTRYCEDASFVGLHLVWATKPDLTRTTVLGSWFHYAENMRFFSSKPPIQSLCSNSWRNNYWTSRWSSDRENFFSKMGLKLQCHHLMIESGHPMVWFLEERVGSSMKFIFPMPNYVLSELQKSEGGATCLTKSKTSNQETGAVHVTSPTSIKETCADTLSIFPSQASFYKRKTILTTERKWKVIPADSSYGGALSIPISTVVTIMVRHYDQDERQTIWRITSLGRHEAGTAESVRKTSSTRFLRETLASTYSWRKQQDSLQVLRGFHNIFSLLSSNSRTFWRNTNWPRVDGVHSNSLQLESTG